MSVQQGWFSNFSNMSYNISCSTFETTGKYMLFFFQGSQGSSLRAIIFTHQLLQLQIKHQISSEYHIMPLNYRLFN